MTPYATPAELANYIDPDGVQFDPVTLTYSDGTTVTLAREAEIVTMSAVAGTAPGSLSVAKPLPVNFQPRGNVASYVASSTDVSGPGAWFVTISELPAAIGFLGVLPGAVASGPWSPFSAEWLAEPVDGVAPIPPLATVLLRYAQALVLDAIAAAIYAVDVNEHATDPDTYTAIKTAILEQAQAWSLAGIDPRKGAGQVGRQVASKSLLGGSVSYVTDPTRDSYLSDLASGAHLTLSAWRILRNAGLIVSTVVSGYGPDPIVTGTPYDPTTGILER